MELARSKPDRSAQEHPVENLGSVIICIAGFQCHSTQNRSIQKINTAQLFKSRISEKKEGKYADSR